MPENARGAMIAAFLAVGLALVIFGVADAPPPISAIGEPTVPASPPEPRTPADDFDIAVELVADDFGELTDVTGIPGTDILLAVEKEGIVRVVEDGVVLPEPFIDVSDSVLSKGNEQGLLSIELHPDFERNGRVLLFLTDTEGDSRLVEVQTQPAEPRVASTEPPRTILLLPQWQQYHQSGSLDFGPNGLLWLSLGDGGGSGDPRGWAQDPMNLYGTIVRLDVDSAVPYAVPAGNPGVNALSTGQAEVWAYGLRNPWRISIDDESGMIYVPDVGQVETEEVNIVSLTDAGQNFGWSVFEGSACYEALACELGGHTPPVYEYPHEGTGCAVVGGLVYRGAGIPELGGHYFFGDYCFGWVRSFAFHEGRLSMERDWSESLGRLGHLTSFGTDGDGELLITNLEGEIWRIVEAP